MNHPAQRASSRFVVTLAAVAMLALVACDEDNREDSPLQADQDVVDVTTPAATAPGSAAEASPTVGTGLSDSPATGGSDITGSPSDDDDDTLQTDEGVQVEPTVIDAVLGDQVTLTGVLARVLSERVITLEGVTLGEQPAEELLVIIPEELTPDYEALDEGSLVAVAGEVVQVTRERLAEVDRSIFEEHGELLEGFRAAWGIVASDVSVAEEGQ